MLVWSYVLVFGDDHASATDQHRQFMHEFVVFEDFAELYALLELGADCRSEVSVDVLVPIGWVLKWTVEL